MGIIMLLVGAVFSYLTLLSVRRSLKLARKILTLVQNGMLDQETGHKLVHEINAERFTRKQYKAMMQKITLAVIPNIAREIKERIK